MQDINIDEKIILITGAAGFIGANLICKLLSGTKNSTVIGIDNLNNFYDPILKQYRLKIIRSAAASNPSGKFSFIEGDISDRNTVQTLFNSARPSIVVNLAAQAGVRYSITNPDAYINSNLIGFYNILEACRGLGDHLVYASSSSVVSRK